MIRRHSCFYVWITVFFERIIIKSKMEIKAFQLHNMNFYLIYIVYEKVCARSRMRAKLSFAIIFIQVISFFINDYNYRKILYF